MGLANYIWHTPNGGIAHSASFDYLSNLTQINRMKY